MKELPAIDLSGFHAPYGCSEYEWGCAAEYPPNPNGLKGVWKEHRYHVEILSWHYHDYMGTHAFVQVWDYAQQNDPDQRWQYMLLLNRPIRQYDADGSIIGSDWGWVIQCEYEGYPTHAQVGADIDLWEAAPESLRFILE